jgi:hypothetical protein
VRIALLLVVIAACERSGSCEQQLKSRFEDDPRWRELFPATWLAEIVRSCRDLEAGRPVSPEMRRVIECVAGADSDDRAYACATKLVGP